MTGKKEVSLLPESENPNSINAKVIKWLTSVGRVSIIITELVIVSAFISRFWLDRKNADLSEVIRQEQAILNTTKDFEKEFSFLQQKLKLIKDFYSSQPDYGQKINAITESTPEDIIFNSIAITKDAKETKNLTAEVSLTAFKEESIIDFLTNLALNPKISSVDINRIEKKQRENNYSIQISLVFNPKS